MVFVSAEYLKGLQRTQCFYVVTHAPRLLADRAIGVAFFRRRIVTFLDGFEKSIVHTLL